MVEAGLPLTQILAILAEVETDPAQRAVQDAVAAAVKNGASLPQALSEHPTVFNPFIVAMIKAGDTGGTLDVNLRRIGEQIARSAAFERT